MSVDRDKLRELIHALIAQKLKDIETSYLSIDEIELLSDMTISVDVKIAFLINLSKTK